MVDYEAEYKELGLRPKSSSFKKWYNAELLEKIDENFVREVKDYWSEKSNRKTDPTLHLAFMNLTGKKEPRVVQYGIMNYEIYPVFNDYSMEAFYGDKNIYDLILNPSKSAVTILRCIKGKYFDKNYNYIDPEKALNILTNAETDMIIKPSRANEGKGISKFSTYNNEVYIGEKNLSIDSLMQEYKGNFIVQEKLEQHENMAAPHPASLNTLRMVTFRWKNEIKYLLAYGRFGSDGDLRDNGSSDSDPRIGIKDSGEFKVCFLARFTHSEAV